MNYRRRWPCDLSLLTLLFAMVRSREPGYEKARRATRRALGFRRFRFWR